MPTLLNDTIRVQERVASEIDRVLKLRPSLREEPHELRDLAQLLEAQCVELAWYENFPRYGNDAEVLTDRGLVNLEQARREGSLHFDFKVLRETLPARMRRRSERYLRGLRRLLNGSGRHSLDETTAGMRTPRCKPAMLAFLNEFSLRVRERLRGSGFRPRVNSILRTREHQLHLISLGYAAPADSVHCVGYAADLEKAWYETEAPAAHGAMLDTLEEYRRDGALNVIDEGLVWHVCLHPSRIRPYARAAGNA